jgi:hypothetical protein
MTERPPVVPFVRELEQGMVGLDVVAVKRALSRAGYIEWAPGGAFSNVAGPFFVTSLNRFKRAKGLKQDGKYSFPTHEALRKSRRRRSRSEWAFDRLAIHTLEGKLQTPEERVLDGILAACDQAILRRDLIRYAQVRPYPDMLPYPNLPNVCDCSQFVTWCYRSGGAPDPNGEVGGTFWRYGFTGTLWLNQEVPLVLSMIRLGDLVFYGTPWRAGGAAHVAICREIRAGKPWVGSMGSDSGPLNLPADYRRIVGVRRPALLV